MPLRMPAVWRFWRTAVSSRTCIIPELAKQGLDGLELHHHANSEKDREIIRAYAAQYDLFLTGGSDFHGKFEGVLVDIGDYLAEPSGVRAVVEGVRR